jgi:hypothetical protein
MLDSDAQSALTDLRWHWDDAYKINCVGELGRPSHYQNHR